MSESGEPVRSPRQNWTASRWVIPVGSVVLGLVMWAAFWAGGNAGQGAIALGVMVAFGAIFALGGRSETIRGMRGDGRDERWAMIDLRATALAGLALITAVIIGFIVEVAQGQDGSPYTWLGALAGVVYIVAFIIGRLRS